jgi:hypothetical protein
LGWYFILLAFLPIIKLLIRKRNIIKSFVFKTEFVGIDIAHLSTEKHLMLTELELKYISLFEWIKGEDKNRICSCIGSFTRRRNIGKRRKKRSEVLSIN